jgi:hypothetical protein
MRPDQESFLTPRWIIFGTALVYFALGSVLTAHFMRLKDTWADSHRVFQLKIHRAAPGKMPVLKERLRCASRLQARHALAVAGYWIPEDAKFTQTGSGFAKTFVYVLSHAGREEAETLWDALRPDSTFREYVQPEEGETGLEPHAEPSPLRQDD